MLGFIGYLFNSYSFVNTVKDISYFIKPIIGIIIGFLTFKDQKDLTIFYRSVIVIGVIAAAVHIGGIILFSRFSNDSIHNLRGDFGLDNFIEIYSLYLILFYKKIINKPLFKKPLHYYTICGLLLVSILLYFSRSMLVCFFIIGFSLLGFTVLNKRALKALGIVSILIGLFYMYLFSIKIDRNSKGVEALFFKIKIAPEEIFETKIDREDHVSLWDHWRAYEVKRATFIMAEKPYSYIVGAGYGSTVNLGFPAPLGENGEGLKHISRLHNGYMFIFYKLGLIGIVFYLIFIMRLYLRIYYKGNDRHLNFNYKLLSSIGVFYLFTSLIISGVYNSREIIIFLVGGALALEANLRKQMSVSTNA